MHVNDVVTGRSDDPTDGSTGSPTGRNDNSNKCLPYICDVCVDLHNHVLFQN